MKKDELAAMGIIALISVLVLAYSQNKNFSNGNETFSPANSTVVTINLPAVDNRGNGVVAKLKVQAIPGDGGILTDINQLFFWVDTQYSIRTAEAVAQNVTGRDLSKTDLIYTIETNASTIEGESAGAGLTIATIAVLNNKHLDPNVMITGTINPDGTIGPVGGILAKATASKAAGANLLLVPAGQGTQINYLPDKTCQQVGPVTLCTTQYKTDTINISKDVGINVKEVSTINDAMNYLIKD